MARRSIDTIDKWKDATKEREEKRHEIISKQVKNQEAYVIKRSIEYIGQKKRSKGEGKLGKERRKETRQIIREKETEKLHKRKKRALKE